MTNPRHLDDRYTVPFLRREQRWVCPNCTQTAVTHHAGPATEFHNCRGLRGIWAPLVADGVNCKVEAKDRDDYVNGDIVQTDAGGRPVMSVVTTRDDGTDLAVYAPCATATTKE